MAHWLLKSEPDVYSFDDLVKDKKTVWDGVANNTALKHIRSIVKGDTAVIYHTGDERSAIGLAEVVTGPYPDPAGDDPKAVVFDLKAGKKFTRPVTLAEIKADPQFAGWDLVRLGRLSVVPVPPKMWAHLLKLAEKPK
jgi:predicted RNA-binding protein with PUA-like domain